MSSSRLTQGLVKNGMSLSNQYCTCSQIKQACLQQCQTNIFATSCIKQKKQKRSIIFLSPSQLYTHTIELYNIMTVRFSYRHTLYKHMYTSILILIESHLLFLVHSISQSPRTIPCHGQDSCGPLKNCEVRRYYIVYNLLDKNILIITYKEIL